MHSRGVQQSSNGDSRHVLWPSHSSFCSSETWEDLKLSKEHSSSPRDGCASWIATVPCSTSLGRQKGCFQLPVFWCYCPCAAARMAPVCAVTIPALRSCQFRAVSHPRVTMAELCPWGWGDAVSPAVPLCWLSCWLWPCSCLPVPSPSCHLAQGSRAWLKGFGFLIRLIST